MTSVDGVSATQGAASTASAQKQLTVDYDTFLHLMMAQMQNQDPTNPMDASEQLAQLASFSQVEQSIQTNAKLETLLTNLSFGQVDDLIGRTVLALDNGQGVLLGPGVTIS